MPDIIQLNNPATDPRLQEYYDELDRLTGLALNGRIDEDAFRRELERVTIAAILLMFILAGGDINAPGADVVIREQNDIARNSAGVLTDDIYSGRYSARSEKEVKPNRPEQTADEGSGKLQNRLSLWVYTLAGVYALGQTYKPPTIDEQGKLAEPIYEWVLGATEQHCTDCAAFAGQRKTASEWQRYPPPQSPDLECGGWRCDCRLVEVTNE